VNRRHKAHINEMKTSHGYVTVNVRHAWRMCVCGRVGPWREILTSESGCVGPWPEILTSRRKNMYVGPWREILTPESGCVGPWREILTSRRQKMALSDILKNEQRKAKY
jgi:hypothetical protein